MKSYILYSFFKNWDTKTCLFLGMLFFAFFTSVLVFINTNEQYVNAAFTLTSQLVASLITYINSSKTNATIVSETEMKEIEKVKGKK